MTSYWKNRLKWQEDILLETGISSSEEKLYRLYKRAAELNEKDLKAMLYDFKENGINSINDLYRYNRYWEVQSEINRRLTELGHAEIKILDKDLVSMYMAVQQYFNKNPKFFARSSNGKFIKAVDAGFVDLNSPLVSAQARTVANAVWCVDGKNFSDRVWSNTDKLRQTLTEGLSDVLIRGKGPDEVATTITMEQFNLSVGDKNKEAFSSAFQRSRTLVNTELAHVYNQAAIQRYRDAGCEYYQVLVAPDNTSKAKAYNTTHPNAKKQEYPCEDCMELDKKTFSFLEMEEGVNCPPFHPNCRCTIIPVIGGN